MREQHARAHQSECLMAAPRLEQARRALLAGSSDACSVGGVFAHEVAVQADTDGFPPPATARRVNAPGVIVGEAVRRRSFGRTSFTISSDFRIPSGASAPSWRARADPTRHGSLRSGGSGIFGEVTWRGPATRSSAARDRRSDASALNPSTKTQGSRGAHLLTPGLRTADKSRDSAARSSRRAPHRQRRERRVDRAREWRRRTRGARLRPRRAAARPASW